MRPLLLMVVATTIHAQTNLYFDPSVKFDGTLLDGSVNILVCGGGIPAGMRVGLTDGTRALLDNTYDVVDALRPCVTGRIQSLDKAVKPRSRDRRYRLGVFDSNNAPYPSPQNQYLTDEFISSRFPSR